MVRAGKGGRMVVALKGKVDLEILSFYLSRWGRKLKGKLSGRGTK